MSGEWQPGDVAHVPGVGCALLCDDGQWVTQRRSRRHDAASFAEFKDVRPLVVIDPEDPQHVQRFHDAYRAARERGGDWRDWTHAALREFANPTPAKPDEPGKGGIVVAGDGREWFRYTTSEINGMDWVRPDARGGTKYARWEDLIDVRVLSEGEATP